METTILIMGAPVLLTLMYCNTMFNENEPIVNRPEGEVDNKNRFYLGKPIWRIYDIDGH